MSPRILRLSKDTPFSVTVGAAIAVIIAVASMAGVALKAKSDIEAANAAQDAEIRRVNDRIDSLKETLLEVRNDVKDILRRKP